MSFSDKNMETYIKTHPFLRETADLQLAVSQVMGQNVSPLEFPADRTVPDMTKGGLPLLQHKELQDKVIMQLTTSLSAVLAGLLALPAPAPMHEVLVTWNHWTIEQSLDKLAELSGLLLRQEDDKIAAFTQAEHLPEQLMRTVLWQMAEALVPARLKQREFWLEAGWDRNYCPLCGRQPVLAHLRKEKEGRARFLLCDGCHTEWPFARVGCVYCDNKDLKEMHILEPEGEPAMRLDVCDKCHSYIKTYNEEGAESIYLQDWATIHLDLLAEEKGLHKKGSRLLANG